MRYKENPFPVIPVIIGITTITSAILGYLSVKKSYDAKKLETEALKKNLPYLRDIERLKLEQILAQKELELDKLKSQEKVITILSGVCLLGFALFSVKKL
ncbi:MAG: hypothetical protein QXO40_00235 [Candidatus Aenigmatarchaeota archaeon]